MNGRSWATMAAGLLLIGGVMPEAAARQTLQVDAGFGRVAVRDGTPVALPATPVRRPLREPRVLLEAAADLGRANDATSPAVVAGSSRIEGFPAGDTDGDALDDVASVEAGDDSLTVQVRSGVDGARRWTWTIERADGALLMPPAGDLDGDAREDLVMLILDVRDGASAGDCAVSSCAAVGGTSYAWTTVVLSGADGRPIWQRTDNGAASSTSISTFSEGAALLGGAAAAPDLIASLDVAPDADGDGLADIIVTLYGLHGTDATAIVATPDGWQGLSPRAGATVVRAEVVRGRDGSLLVARAAIVHAGAAGMVAVGDGDLAWWVFDSERAMVERIVAQRTAWLVAHDVPAPSFAVVTAPRADLDGDGVADLLLDVLSGNDPFERWVSSLSGADGAIRWTRPGGGQTHAIGTVDGGPGMDLVVNRGELDDGGIRVRLDRVDGATGALLHDTSMLIPGPDGFGFVRVSVDPIGDADGDGVIDSAVGGITVSCAITCVAESSWRAESGVDGTMLFERSEPRLLYVAPSGDSNGDGLADLVVTSVVEQQSETSLRIEGVGGTGDVRWQRSFSVRASFEYAVRPARDTGGVAGGDLIVSIIEANVGSSVRVLDGANGEDRWVI